MAPRTGYFTTVMGMCDPDRFYRPTLAHRSASSFTSWSSHQSEPMRHGYGGYHNPSSSGMATPDSRSTYAYQCHNHQAAMAAAPQNHYQQRNVYQPRMAGASTRRGGFHSHEDVLRSARAHNSDISGEYEKFRPVPIAPSDGSLEFSDDFPSNAHELFLMDFRELQDLCSLFRIDAGRSRTDHINAFLKHIGAIHIGRAYSERDNYGSEY
ncbi:hypothetical protein DRE_03707 [Drechslerella stenobrocha 248]|uniref:Uncharacterized protein n=1 Tax=Drechslerella stenobrocha 248 TaxID=1043628 RepID=W7ICS9_9PEZI|nr:hypothetical protein DRE_03707 [Drechslerella stenobrocha 248]